MDGAANAAQGLFIAGRSLQRHRLLVERLQQFLRALEEELAQLGGALVVPVLVAVFAGNAHAITSTFWYAVPLLWCTIWNISVRPSRLSAWPTNRYPCGFKQR